jgi:hypothetical protein
MHALDFFNYQDLIERWRVTHMQFMGIIYDAKVDLYFPSPGGRRFEKAEPHEWDHIMQRPSGPDLKEALYSIEDVESLEKDTPGLNKQTTPNDARELGRLRTAVHKQDEYLNAAVIAGLFASKQNKPITKKMLWSELEENNLRNLPDAMFEKIWKMIPQKLRHTGGRPKKTSVK